MARYGARALSIENTRRISISFLKKNGFLKHNRQVSGIWNLGTKEEPKGGVSIITKVTKEESYLQLKYSITLEDGNIENIDYKITLEKVASNLGKGYRFYFFCPFTFKRCETIYMAYDSEYFKHRDAYFGRLFYTCQMESKSLARFRYLDVQTQIENLYKKKVKDHYKGIKTRLTKRIEKLEDKIDKSLTL